MKAIRILLVDDHKIVRDGLKLLIEGHSDLAVVGEAANGEEAVRKAGELSPDVVVMDLSMPVMNGLRATVAMVSERPRTKVLVLTTHEDPSYLRQLCQAKAVGYVLKRSAGDELIKAIRQVARGEVYFDATLAGQALVEHVHVAGPRREEHGGELSDREEEVLRGVALGYTNKELANQLEISVKTVETYKVRLGQKLGLTSRAEMVRYALRQGWLNETRPLAQLTG
jgi:two-component system, NarL family, response regulator NreC